MVSPEDPATLDYQMSALLRACAVVRPREGRAGVGQGDGSAGAAALRSSTLKWAASAAPARGPFPDPGGRLSPDATWPPTPMGSASLGTCPAMDFPPAPSGCGRAWSYPAPCGRRAFAPCPGARRLTVEASHTGDHHPSRATTLTCAPFAGGADVILRPWGDAGITPPRSRHPIPSWPRTGCTSSSRMCLRSVHPFSFVTAAEAAAYASFNTRKVCDVSLAKATFSECVDHQRIARRDVSWVAAPPRP